MALVQAAHAISFTLRHSIKYCKPTASRFVSERVGAVLKESSPECSCVHAFTRCGTKHNRTEVCIFYFSKPHGAVRFGAIITS